MQLAKTFAGNSTVAGFDLDNEPTQASPITWGDGGPTDIHKMFTDVGNAIQAVDPGALIIGEGPQNYNTTFSGNNTAPEGDLTQAAVNPVSLNVANKMMYSVHEYPNEISAIPNDTGASAIQRMNNAWGYLVTQNIAPVWIGEMGSNMTSSDSQAWAQTLVDYMNGKDAAQGGPAFTGKQQGIGGSWWNIGWEGGAPGTGAGGGVPDGNQDAWGIGNYRPLQQAVTDQMLFKPS